jgi:hypothetical protein
MTKNPFLNALAASTYIVVIVSLIFNAEKFLGKSEETVLIPMAMLSLLVLSVALMGYLFFYQPLLLILDGRKKEGVDLFLMTIAVFAGITLLLLALVAFLAK